MGRPWRVVVWDDETIDRVTRLVINDGLSASQVAERLQDDLPGLTRNAIIGKLYRLGIFWRSLTTRQSRVRTRRARTSTSCVPVAESPWIKIEDLNFWTCRFPKGDPSNLDEFRYCGLPSLGRAYCPYHCGLAYLPARAA